jgi:hypothetical protein
MPHRFSFPILHLFAALAAVLAWRSLGPLTFQRTASFQLSVQHPGQFWRVTSNADRTPAITSTTWVDVGLGIESAESPSGSRLLALRVAIPWQHDTVALTCMDRADASLASDQALPSVMISERLLWWRADYPAARLAAKADPAHASELASGDFRFRLESSPLRKRLWIESLLVIAASQLATLTLWRFRRPRTTSIDIPARSTATERLALALIALLHAALALTTPLFYPPDAVDYLANARQLLETRSFDHFAAYRPPGYSILLMPLLKAADWLHLSPIGFNTLLGGIQAGLTIATTAFAGSLSRRFFPRPFPALVVLLVGLSPVAALYQRQALTEPLSAFALIAILWLATTRSWWSGTTTKAIAGSIIVGLLIAAACYVRGNFQLLAILVPLVIGWPGGPRRSSLASLPKLHWATTLLIPLVTLLAISPWLLRNAHKFNQPRMVVLSDFKRCISGYDAGLVTLDRAGIFPLETWRSLNDARKHGRLGGYQLIDALTAQGQADDRAANAPALDPWIITSRECKELVDDAVAKDPPARWLTSLSAFANLAGFRTIPTAGYQENLWWARPILESLDSNAAPTRADNHWEVPEAFRYIPIEQARRVESLSRQSIDGWRGSTPARAVKSWIELIPAYRATLAWLGFVGVFAAWLARDRALCILAAIPFVHAAAVAVMLYAGEDRYQMPFETLLAVASIAPIALMTRRRTTAAPEAANSPQRTNS